MKKLLRHDLLAVTTGALALVIGLSLQSSYRPVTLAASPMATPSATEVLGASGMVSGNATWYDWRLGQAAAGPKLRAALGSHWRGQTVTVCAQACVRVRLTDWCLCSRGNRIIDLDDQAFAKLAPLSAGVIAVTIRLGSSRPEPESAPTSEPTAPATDID